jgi:DNA-directed RNA polymerase specialized sigma24 family protein
VTDGSFDAFVAERSTELLRTASLLTGDAAAARDLLQDALIAVHRHWDQLAGDEQAAARARRELVAAHTGRLRRLWIGDLLASSTLLAGTSGLPGFGPPGHGAGPPPDGTAAAVARLPRRVGATLVLRYGQELPESATAEALGCPVEEVRARTRRGLARLRDELDGAAGADDAALTERLRRDLAARAAQVPAAPDGLAGQVRDGQRARRHHLAGLWGLAAFLVVVVLLVAVNL